MIRSKYLPQALPAMTISARGEKLSLPLTYTMLAAVLEGHKYSLDSVVSTVASQGTFTAGWLDCDDVFVPVGNSTSTWGYKDVSFLGWYWSEFI